MTDTGHPQQLVGGRVRANAVGSRREDELLARAGPFQRWQDNLKADEISTMASCPSAIGRVRYPRRRASLSVRPYYLGRTAAGPWSRAQAWDKRATVP